MNRYHKRQAIWGLCIIGVFGLFANLFLSFAISVNLPGFDGREGIIGTRFLNSLLYSMGSDSSAMFVVHVLYFIYGCIAGSFVWVGTYFFRKRPPEKGICRHCGYDLRASKGFCPECGCESH